MTDYETLVGAAPGENWEDATERHRMVLELGALVCSLRINCKVLSSLLDRTEGVAFPKSRRRCALMAEALHELAVKIQLNYALSLAADSMPLTAEKGSWEYSKQSSVMVDAAYGTHADSIKASTLGRWNTVDALEDQYLKWIECVHDRLSLQKISATDGVTDDQRGGCSKPCTAALMLSRITTPATARAFQALQCNTRMMTQLARELQKLPDDSMSPTVLTEGVEMVRNFTAGLGRLAGARKHLKEVPAALEHLTEHAIRAATWHAWDEACDLARRGGKSATRAADWAENCQLKAEMAAVELAQERARWCRKLRLDKDYIRFCKAAELAAPEEVARKRARIEFEMENGCDFVEVEPNARVYVRKEDHDRKVLIEQEREKIQKRRELLNAKLSKVTAAGIPA
jgi:hypothetical protein